MTESLLNSCVEAISIAGVRYEGVLVSVDPVASTLTLSNVKCHGTEARRPGSAVPPSEATFKTVVLRRSDIEVLNLVSREPTAAGMPPALKGGGGAQQSSVEHLLRSRVEIVSKRTGVRYEGVLAAVDEEASSLTLSNVKCHGIEASGPDSAIFHSQVTYEAVVFRASDIEKLSILSTSMVTATAPDLASKAGVCNEHLLAAVNAEASSSTFNKILISRGMCLSLKLLDFQFKHHPDDAMRQCHLVHERHWHDYLTDAEINWHASDTRNPWYKGETRTWRRDRHYNLQRHIHFWDIPELVYHAEDAHLMQRSQSPDLEMLQSVLCLVALAGHPACGFANLNHSFRNDVVLWDCIRDRRGSNGWTFLMVCACSGNLARVHWLLSRGANVNAVETSKGLSSLMLASQNGHLEIVRELLEHGADVNAATNESGNTEDCSHQKTAAATANGCTSLMMACEQGHLEIVRELLCVGADANAVESCEGLSSLMMACRNGHLEIVRDLLEHGANVNAAATEDGSTSLMVACVQGHLEIVRELIGRGADANATQTDNFKTCLMYACQKGYLNIVRELIECGADMHATHVDSKSFEDENYSWSGHIDSGWSSLMLACREGHQEVVHELIKRGVNADADFTDDGETPLMLACEYGHHEIVRELLEQGVNVNAAKTNTGWTPLMFACQNGSIENIHELLGRGAKVNAPVDAQGKTPLMLACIQGNLKVVRFLLACSADVDTRAIDPCWTSLMFACEKGHFDIVQELLGCGANANAEDSCDGRTSLMLACEQGHLDVVRKLLECKASVNSSMSGGWTPLMYACETGGAEIVHELLKYGAESDVRCLVLARRGQHMEIVRDLETYL